MPEPVLEVRDLTVHFYTYAGIVKAIEGVSFDVYRGETFALVGETGCGKSVTSRALTQLIESPGRIVRGKVIYHREDGSEVDLLRLSEEEIREIRGKEIAYIFQDPHASLDPLYTVGYQIAEAMVVHKTVKDWKEGFRRAVDILKRVLIPDPENRVKNYPHELSGGMKQRVVIGIGVSNDPKILIADEPTTALDVTVQAQILDLMNKLKKEYNTTVILITHNMGVVAEMADRVAVMYAGKIVEIGSVDQIFKNPLHPYTKGLLRAVPNPLAKIERLEAIPGTVPNLITPPKGCRFHPRCPYATEICRKEVPKLKEIEPGHFVACHLY
ncbi:ABC transporter ATP-binding protein [Thermococcus sp. AM4]|uniref:ABC transporter ATP-binding protein n=1 Tax=Thermococcus sp. (strain AM4) TaxID=246969 RepID=UPI0001870645|nr:ABC transporter ATP-binding protein [Thermococcus sp. AM4]EEB74627.1 Dipeptide transport ATP-binding protein, DppD-like protein [Thermococcus sp. AM4]